MGENLHSGHRQRVKDRFLKGGLDHFDCHQILEMLLFYGISRKDTNELAHRLLNRFHTLSGVLKASYRDLLSVKGMTPHAATLIRFCGELSVEYVKDVSVKHEQLETSDKIGDYMRPYFLGLKKEIVMMMCLNNRFEVLDCARISEGSVNATDVSIRLIVERALQYNATMVVIAHNHPEGFATPSKEDVYTTDTIKNALSIVNVSLFDHIVYAQDDYVSMRQTPSTAMAFFMDSGRRRMADAGAEENMGAV